MEKDKLTKTQEKLLIAIKEFKEKNDYSPTVRELGEMTGRKSPATIFSGLQILKRKGYIDFIEKQPRTIRVIK